MIESPRNKGKNSQNNNALDQGLLEIMIQNLFSYAKRI